MSCFYEHLISSRVSLTVYAISRSAKENIVFYILTLLLLIQLKRIDIFEKARLIRPLLRRQIDILHPKFNSITLRPLQIINQTPRQTSHDVHPVRQRHQDRLHVVMVVPRARKVETDICLDGLELLKRLRKPELRHRHPAARLPCVLDVPQKLWDPVRRFVQPRTAWVGGVADVPAPVGRGVCVRAVDAARIQRVGRVGEARGEPVSWGEVELRCVAIMGEMVRRAFDHAFLRLGEGQIQRRDVLFQIARVVARQVDGVGEPALVEVPGALHGDRVVGRVAVRDFVAAVVLERDGAVDAEGAGEVVGAGVREENVMAAVELLLFWRDGGRLEIAFWIRVFLAEDNWLVYGVPLLHFLAPSLEDDFGVCDKVIHNLLV